MRVPPAFSSPFLAENITRLTKDPSLSGQLHKHFSNALYALTYHLENALPKGGVVCALYPKTLLEDVLPNAAKEKKCTVISLHGTKSMTRALLSAGMLETTQQEPDLYLVEPAAFTPGGAYVLPLETGLLHGKELIGIGSIFQWTSRLPATHDYVPLYRVITELGIHSPEYLYTEINASSWIAPSTLSAPYRVPFATP